MNQVEFYKEAIYKEAAEEEKKKNNTLRNLALGAAGIGAGFGAHAINKKRNWHINEGNDRMLKDYKNAAKSHATDKADVLRQKQDISFEVKSGNLDANSYIIGADNELNQELARRQAVADASGIAKNMAKMTYKKMARKPFHLFK